MRLALISDIHYGIKDDHHLFLNHNRKFFDEIFFPRLDQDGIRVVCFLGDLFHRRKYCNIYTANRIYTDLIRPLRDRGIYFHFILGNHDIYYKETSDVNGAGILPSEIYVYKDATDVKFGGCEILFVPWITKENEKRTLEKIKNTSAQIIMGHLELQGFEMQNGVLNVTGMSPDVYAKFDLVLTGHFHKRSYKGNIHYLGSHGELIWSDYGDSRGFYIFDTETRGMTFVENPNKIFAKVWYDDADSKSVSPPQGFESLRNKFVKVIVSGRNDPAKYDWFINQIEKVAPADIKVVEDHLNLNLTDDAVIVSETKDTLSIIRDYVKQANNIVNTDKLDNLVVDLYNRAIVDE